MRFHERAQKIVPLGRRNPAKKRDGWYHCEVDQVIIGIDQISTLDFQRANAPATIDPRRSKVNFVSEQMRIHEDRIWAGEYFNAASWNHVYTGTGTTPAAGEFYHLDSDNCDPVKLFKAISNRMLLSGLRRSNRVCFGVNAFAAITQNTSILERVCSKVKEVCVAESVYNAAPRGKGADMRFICDPAPYLPFRNMNE